MTPDEVMARAMSELQLKTEAARTILGFSETGSNWSVDLESGLFTYTRANGIVATAPVQIIGTLNTRAGTFLWGWDHPSVPEKCRSDAQRVREWGKTNGRPEMTRGASFPVMKALPGPSPHLPPTCPAHKAATADQPGRRWSS